MTSIPLRVVVCAANKCGPYLFLGAHHGDHTMYTQTAMVNDHVVEEMRTLEVEQGFIDQWGIFMDRKTALEVATNADQINIRRAKKLPLTELFSEDLY